MSTAVSASPVRMPGQRYRLSPEKLQAMEALLIDLLEHQDNIAAVARRHRVSRNTASDLLLGRLMPWLRPDLERPDPAARLRRCTGCVQYTPALRGQNPCDLDIPEAVDDLSYARFCSAYAPAAGADAAAAGAEASADGLRPLPRRGSPRLQRLPAA